MDNARLFAESRGAHDIYLPFLWMISTSLQTFRETMTFPPTWIPASPQWGNFAEAMQAGPFLTYFRNSVVVTGSIIVLQFLIMIPAAYAFAKYKFPGKTRCSA